MPPVPPEDLRRLQKDFNRKNLEAEFKAQVEQRVEDRKDLTGFYGHPFR